MWLLADYWLIIKNHILDFIHPHPPQKWQSGNRGHILLIQGIYERWHFLQTLGNYLNSLGYRIHFIKELNNLSYPLIKCQAIIQHYIQTHKLRDFVIIGYSKGGISAKSTSGNIKTVITIATPHQGSYMGIFLPSSWELLPLKLKTVSINSKIINIYPKQDNFVIPNKSLILSNAQNIQLPISGHTLILESPELLTEISKHL